MVNGEIDMGELCKRPGWGIEVNEAALAKYPSKRQGPHREILSNL